MRISLVVLLFLGLAGCSGYNLESSDFYAIAGIAGTSQATNVKIARYQALGLVGDHELVQIGNYSGIEGEFSGGFFNSTSGSFRTGQWVYFLWRYKDCVFVGELPISRIHIEEVIRSDTPTIRFQYNMLDIPEGENQRLYSILSDTRGLVHSATIRGTSEQLLGDVYFKLFMK